MSDQGDYNNTHSPQGSLSRQTTSQFSAPPRASTSKSFASTAPSYTSASDYNDLSDPNEFDALRSTGGIRTPFRTPRGYLAKGASAPSAAEKSAREIEWLPKIQAKIRYDFENPDLLEEALETEGSGVVAVGGGKRDCKDGNVGLAKVGKRVIKLVGEDCGYLLREPAKNTEQAVKTLLSNDHLISVGEAHQIVQFVRPKERAKERSKTASIMKVVTRDPSEGPGIVATAVLAVVGAVYFDGGYQAVKEVLRTMDLLVDREIRSKYEPKENKKRRKHVEKEKKKEGKARAKSDLKRKDTKIKRQETGVEEEHDPLEEMRELEQRKKDEKRYKSKMTEEF